MEKSRDGFGSRKHGQSGKASNYNHFMGKKAGKPLKRKGTTRKQRKVKHGTHINKYV